MCKIYKAKPLFDWAYEEEFSIQDGFQWGPDSQRIAYWQLDTSAAQDFYIINNTDTLYPTITAIPYPKVGEENSAARIGVVSIANSETRWIELPGIPKDMYVPRMSWVQGQNQVLIQQMNRMHRRAIRALKSPVESGRKLIQRFR